MPSPRTATAILRALASTPYELASPAGAAATERWQLHTPPRPEHHHEPRDLSGVAGVLSAAVQGAVSLTMLRSAPASAVLLGLALGTPVAAESMFGQTAMLVSSAMVAVAGAADVLRRAVAWKRHRPEVHKARAWAAAGGVGVLDDRKTALRLDADGRVRTRLVPLVRDPRWRGKYAATIRVDFDAAGKAVRAVETTAWGRQRELDFARD